MTKAITINIPHELGRAEARKRIDEGFERFSHQMGGVAGAVTRSWDGDRLAYSLTAMGQTISGTIEVLEKTVKLEVLLPNLLGMIAGKLKGRLQKEGQLLLEKKK
jgi:putative polyhydroxyalkanoate system protein